MPSFFNAAVRAALLAVLFTASGCATVVKGTDESVSVMTEPAGAACDLERDGHTIAVIKETPDTVEVDRDKDDIVVTCDLAKHETTVGRLESEFGGATLGNVILGGVIGLAVDAASGANNEYPESITLIMKPSQFDSVARRDQYYGHLKRQVSERFEEKISDQRTQCGEDELCDKRIERIVAERDAEIEQLEKQRLSVRIASSG